MATNDPKIIAQELFNLLMNAASSTRRGGNRKVEQPKEQREYSKWLKRATENYKAQDAVQRSKLARDKVIGKQYDDILKKVTAFGTSIEDAIEKAKSLKELEKIPETVSKIFASSSSSFVKQLANQAKSLEGIFQIENLASVRKDVLTQLSTMSDRTKLTVEEYNTLNEMMTKAGTSFANVGIVAKSVITNGKQTGVLLRTTTADLSDLKKETADLADTMNKSAEIVTSKFNNSINSFASNVKEKITQMGSLANVMAALQAVRTDFEKQREFAAADVSTMQALRLGVTLSQLTDGYVTHRMTLLAMQSANKDVEAEMRDTASTFREFSRDNDQAIRNLLGSMQVTSKFGVAQEKLTGAVDKQAQIYKKSFQPLGLSMEQMNELSIQMSEDLDVRRQMAAMDMSERRQMMEAKQARYAEIQAIYGAGRAMEIFRAEQQRAAMKPTERFKTAMYAEPAFATLGMASQGKEYRELLFALPKLTGKEREQANARLTEIQSQVANRFEQLAATNIGQAMAAEKAFEKTGINIDSFFTSSTAGTEGQQVSMQLARDTVNEQRKLNGIVSDIMTGMNFLQSTAQTSTVQLATSVAALLISTSVINKTIGATSRITHSKLDSIRSAILGKDLSNGNVTSSGGGKKPPQKGGKILKGLKIGGPIAGLAAGAYGAYDTLNTAENPSQLGEGLGSATGTALGSIGGGAMTGALMGAALGPIGAGVGMIAGSLLGAWGGGELGSLIGKQIAEEFSTPSMKEQSAVNTSNLKGEQHNNEVLKNLTALIEQARLQNTMSAEQLEELIKVQKQMMGTMKTGFNQNVDAVNKQTDEYLKQNIKSSNVSLTRGSNPTGNP